MARPRKETIDYFSHDVVRGKTLYILERRFGNDGYAFWFKLLEMLGRSQGQVIDTRNPLDWEFLVAETLVKDETATEILNLCAELEAIDKELWVKFRIIWCQKFVDRLEEVYKKRKTEPPQKPIIAISDAENPAQVEFPTQKPQGSEVSGAEMPQSKVKESKVKEIITPPIIPPSSSGDEENPNPKPDPPEKKEKIFSSDSVEYRLAEKLRDLIHNRDPSAKNPNLQKWAKDIDLLHRVDNRSFGTIEDVIEWCQEDSFWQDNILSPGKLRTNFQQLYLKMKNNGNGKKQSKGGFISDHSGKKYEGTPLEDIPWLKKEDENVSLQ